MAEDFRERIDYQTPALALAVWAMHFSLLWGASSIFPGQPAARWIALVLTIVAAGALFYLWRREKVRSVFSVPGLGIAIAAVSVGYGAMPALVG